MASDKLAHLNYKENRLSFFYDINLFAEGSSVTFEYRINEGQWIRNASGNQIHLEGLSNGHYVLEVRTSSANLEDVGILSISFRILPPFWKSWWFLLLVALGCIFSIYLYFQLRFKRLKERSAIDLQMAELKTTALRAQMNPHFVFNSLNAIQECIVTGKVDEAYTYLSKFSRLLRLVLQQSDASEISLQEEIEVLDLYVSLEKLRFKDDLKYELQLDDELDPEEIRIPPMLIQPHLENAIWHGLRHQTGQKELKLSITEREHGYLDVRVEDNGIGRKKSGELNASRLGEQRHKSKGRQLSAGRLDLLKKLTH